METQLYNILCTYNPWLTQPDRWSGSVREHLPDPYFPRMLKIEMQPDKASLVIGPRQAGKSTLLWHTVSGCAKPVLYCNCEEPAVREFCVSPALVFQELQRMGTVSALLFDEIQHLEEAGLFLKGLVDLKPGIPILATGSSSYHLRSKTRESLAGRAIRHQLLPMSMEERKPENISRLAWTFEGRKIWDDFLLLGGYPERFATSDPERFLARLVESFVLRDASDLYKIKHPGAMRKLLQLAASQIGDLVNYSNWAEVCGITVNTVAQYLSILEESHVIALVSPFAGGKRAEIKTRPKIYFLDNGLRNILFGGFASPHIRPDRGQLAENLVFSEISKILDPLRDQVRFWRSTSQAEVDFVLETEQGLTAIEVKAAAMKRPRITRSLRSFIQAYHPERVFVVNSELETTARIEGAEVRFIQGHTLFEHV